MRMSVDSSISWLRPKYPMRFSVKFDDATSLMHSTCPKWVGYPSKLKKRSFAMLRFL